MKEEIPSSEDIQNTLDNLEKEAEKNLEEAKTKLHWHTRIWPAQTPLLLLARRRLIEPR